MTRKVLFYTIFLASLIGASLGCYLLQSSYGSLEQNIIPTDTYQVFAYTDSSAGGYSTCNLRHGDDGSYAADVNIRSGKAYPYAGIGINLLSVNHRPAADFFDFSKYDSISVDVGTFRVNKLELRILNNDPVYSVAGNLFSYRPKVVPIAAEGVTKLGFLDFKTPEWWLAEQGLEHDDYMNHFDRGALVAVVNGENVLRGIPGEMQLKSIRLWGRDRFVLSCIYGGYVLFVVAWSGLLVLFYRRNKASHRSEKCK